jgi:chemotaxis protein methyltransferase CheR
MLALRLQHQTNRGAEMSTMTIADELSLSDREFKSIQSMIHQFAGIALADSKHVMVQSRLAKHVRRLQLDSYSDYVRFLECPENTEEVTTFINALTTNKTDFFREKHHFDFLMTQVFPELKRKAEASGNRRLRIWCSASSTGEEPYTIAMCVREFFGENSSWDIRILASDIDTDVLTKASDGVYDAERFLDIPPVLIKKYFEKQGRGDDVPARAKATLRELITFRRLNLLDDQWPISTVFDIIFCRNVMIYFDRPSQTKIVEHFAEYLKPDGHLIIGHSEALFGITNRFKSIGDTIYTLECSETPKSNPLVVKTHSREQPLSVRSKHTDSPAAPHVELCQDEPKKSIIIGEVFSSRKPMWISTLLGSCVAVCLYDDVAKVGGMNHFMLPTPSDDTLKCASYGIHSMELLINSVMRSGGDRRRLKAKLFGGGNVIQTSAKQARIGASNVEFAEQVLNTENIPIVAQLTDCDTGMNVKFHTHTHKVIVRMLDPDSAEKIQRRDEVLAFTLQKKFAQLNEVVLF